MLDLVEWAQRFIATPSVSRDGNAAIAGLARELLSRIGLEARLDGCRHEGVEQFNLVADLSVPAGVEPAGDGLLLLTHLDTVPPGDPAAWTETGGDPFRPTRKGDALYGLGSADAKVDLVCKIAALEGLDRARLRRPIRVVGTFGEEIGLLGARRLVASGGTRGFRYALVGEPSELAGIRAHKGYAVFEARIALRPGPRTGAEPHSLELAGRSAHSSTPHLGENAIESALDALARDDVGWLCEIEGGGAVNVVPACARLAYLPAGDGDDARPGAIGYEKEPLVAFHRTWRAWLAELAGTRDADFDPDHTVANLGRIELRPHEDVCAIRFDVRPVPGVDVETVVKPLEARATVEKVRANPPLCTPRSAALVKALERAQRAAGRAPCIATKATCTEAGLLAASGGLEVLVFGAGLSVGNVHRPNEHTRISELEAARRVYRGVIEELCMESRPCSS